MIGPEVEEGIVKYIEVSRVVPATPNRPAAVIGDGNPTSGDIHERSFIDSVRRRAGVQH